MCVIAEEEKECVWCVFCVCVFVTCASAERGRKKSLPFKKKKKKSVHINAVLVCLSLKDSVSCPGCTLVGAIMERAVVQITLFGLLLALVTTLPHKVRSHNLKDRAPLCKETQPVEYIQTLYSITMTAFV